MFVILMARIVSISVDCLAVLDVPEIPQTGLDVAVFIFID
jgi:hypothetical protein